MNGKAMIVLGSALLTGICTIAFFIFERRRYLTNNPNAVGEDFNVHPDNDCPICLEPMDTDGSSCALLSCGHFLHRQCLRDLDNARGTLETNKCPICRTPIRFS